MRYSSLFLFIKGCLVQIKSNKSRLALTMMGVVLANIMFLFLSVLFHTYVNKLYQEAEGCSKQGVLLSGTITEEIEGSIKVRYGLKEIGIFRRPIVSCSVPYTWGDMSLDSIPMIIGTNAGLFIGPVYSTIVSQSMYDTKIVEGRTIQNDDILYHNRVVVISELASMIWFGEKAAIGEWMELSLTGYEEDKELYQVIGVYKNAVDEETVINQVNEAKRKGMSGKNILLNCYIPESIYNEYESAKKAGIAAITIETGTEIEKKQEINNYYSTVKNIQVTFYEEKVQNVDDMYADMMLIMRGLMILMMLISGLNLFNSMMFSIKERVNEIGIRKAVGASSFDIVRQFLFESLFIAILGGMAATLFFSFGAAIVQIYFDYCTVLSVDIVLNSAMIAESFCYVILMSLVFSLIPAIVAARIHIVDAIRFD